MTRSGGDPSLAVPTDRSPRPIWTRSRPGSPSTAAPSTAPDRPPVTRDPPSPTGSPIRTPGRASGYRFEVWSGEVGEVDGGQVEKLDPHTVGGRDHGHAHTVHGDLAGR